jgi:hypothetical protein
MRDSECLLAFSTISMPLGVVGFGLNDVRANTILYEVLKYPPPY